MPADPLDALRAADPARRLGPLTPDELGARRATLPAPPVRAPRRAHAPRGRRLAVLAIAVLALALAAGAAVAAGVGPWERDARRQAGPSTPGATTETAGDVFAREYAAAQAALILPPGATWPAREIPSDVIIATGRGGAGESMAVLIAMTSWQCYVADAADRGDAAATRAGIAALYDLVDHHLVDVPEGTPEDGSAPSEIPGPIAQEAPGGQAIMRGWVDDAAAGDVSRLRDACIANGPV